MPDATDAHVFRAPAAAFPLDTVRLGAYLAGIGWPLDETEPIRQFGTGMANINYRLAPRHPFPAAIEDACAAVQFVARRAAEFGADASRLVVAGESAGANLAVSLALCGTYRRPEPFARAVFDAGIQPRAVAAACRPCMKSGLQPAAISA